MLRVDLVPPKKGVSIRWIARDLVPIGRLTAIQGRSTAGKSSLAAWIAHEWLNAVTRGPRAGKPKKGKRQILLREREGDSSRQCSLYLPWATGVIHLIPTAKLSDLQAELKPPPCPTLVILDPIGSMLPEEHDPNCESHVRPYMESISELCCGGDNSVTIIGMNHPRKSAGHAVESTLGAVAWSAVPRCVLRAEKQTLQGDIGYVAQIVNNIGSSQPTYRYRLTSGLPIVDDVPSTVGIEQVMSGTGGEQYETDDAEQLFLDAMVDGIVRSSTITEMARQCGIGVSAVRRARARLGLIKELVHEEGAKFWIWKDPKAGE